jgi:16S rRNA (adenine(1408)-N(1))-methyltransferase
VDIGTGDGRFVYQRARANPDKFYVGIDVNPAPLEKVSEKAHRKPAKGGAPNVLFVQAPIGELPAELNGTADEVHIHFPWGSLLSAIWGGDETTLAGIRRICARDALLEVVIGLDPERDRSELGRLGLTGLSEEHSRDRLARCYTAAGFDICEMGMISPGDWPCLDTTWAKRLRVSRSRQLFYLIARAV